MTNSPDKFETAVKRLEEFCRKLKSENDSAGQDPDSRSKFLSTRPVSLFSREGLDTMMLDEPDSSALYGCLLDLHKAVPHGRDAISLRAVELAVHEAILKAFSALQETSLAFDGRLTSALVELRRILLQAPKQFWIHLPVAGLVLSELPKKVGSIEFYKGASLISQVPLVAQTQAIAATPYARILVKASDSHAAVEMAVRELRQTCDLLNYFGGVVGNREARICLPWDAKAFLAAVGISETEENRLSSFSHQWRGPFIPFSLNLLFDEPRAGHGGFTRALEIISKVTRTSLEDRLLSAIQWAGRATVEERREEAFLLFTVALESLVVSNEDKEQITQRFAIRGAHLIGQHFASRKELYKRLKKLYGLRSAIVHSGSIKVTDADKGTIAYFVRAAIFTMLTLKPFTEMKTVEEFHSWFEDQVLGRQDI